MEKMIQAGKRGFPTFAYFEVTHRCNARCDYCYIHDKETSEDLDTGSVFKVIDALHNAGILGIIFTGGDPFMRRDFVEIVEYAVKKDFFSIKIFTNGTNIVKEDIGFLGSVKKHVSVVSMTLFSHIAEVNDGYFGVEGACERILANVRLLLEKGIKVFLKVPVLDFNMETFCETMYIVKQMGCEVRSFPFVTCHTYNDPQGLTKYSSVERFRRYLQRVDAKERVALFSSFEKKTNMPNPDKSLCRGKHINIGIDNKGEIRPCLSFFELTIGNILQVASLKELLNNSEIYQELRCLEKTAFQKCSNCSYVGYCIPCIAEMYTQNHKFEHPPENACNWAKAIDVEREQQNVATTCI
jgi:radical SAM protein with 4Fe4S-binding SPASM domain